MQQATLLLTDVVDSTQLTESLGTEPMAAVWAEHDRMARDLLRAHGGREIDKTDGFLLLFEGVDAAVAYALAYHRGLRGLPTPVLARAGLHVGDVLLRENNAEDVALGAKPLDVEGLAKPFTARIMSLAQGGQTLLSPSAHAALGSTAHRTLSHGHWRMKGVIDPIELFEVGDDGAPFTPPPDSAKVWQVVLQNDAWVPVRDVEHTLLRERDAFVGRQRDLLELAGLLDGGAALISILGIGGTGKTRLATHYGWTWLGAWPGGVYFGDLSDARSVNGIVFAVGRALRIPVNSRDPVEQIGFAIEARGTCLVILDNFEQITRHAAETLGKWLDAAPKAQFLVTTREVLGLPGEHALALPPLTQANAVALFEARGKQAKRGFALTESNRADITELVELLDCLPLAIELAAARLRMMPPHKLLQRMGQRFKLLTSTGGRRDRQATLRATIDWSWDLLSPDEQSGLAQLSSYEGGFTLEAVEGVLECGEAWGTDILQALIDKSLVRQLNDERFDLLVSVQAYASEKLEGSAEREGAWQRHAAHYAALEDDAMWERLGASDDGPRPEELFIELDNVVVAHRRAMALSWWQLAERTACAVGQIAMMHGPAAVGLDVLGALDAQGHASARTQLWHWWLLRATGQGAEADARMERAQALDDGSYWGGRALAARARHYADRGEVERAQEFLAEMSSAPRLAPYRLYTSAFLSSTRSDHAEAESTFRQALVLFESQGLRFAQILLNLGVSVAQLGRVAEAEALWARAANQAAREGDASTAWFTQSNLGELRASRGALQAGLADAREAVRGLRAMGQSLAAARLTGVVSWLSLLAGQPSAAVAVGEPAWALLDRQDNAERCKSLLWLGVAHRLLGEGSTARTRLLTASTTPTPQWAVLAQAQLALLDLDEGALDPALSHALDAWARRQEALEYLHDASNALAQVHIARGELPQAREVLDTAWSEEPQPLSAADLHGCETLLAAARGDRATYSAHLASLDQWPDLGHPDSPLGRVLARAAAVMDGL